MRNNYLSPGEVAENMLGTGCSKCGFKISQTFLLGIFAGIFIALGGFASQVASYAITNASLARLVAAAVFPVGLMLILIAGGELFTGNNLITMALCDRRITVGALLGNWTLVYLSNFIGAVIAAHLISLSGLLNMGGGVLGGTVVKTAALKANLDFVQALARGILCNMLVVLAVWMAASARDIAGKVLACWFPVMLFVLSGYEHSVANMYFIPLGIMAKSNPVFSTDSGLQGGILQNLNYGGLFGNLIPVTLGNIIGGGLIVGCIYWYVYIKCQNNKAG